MPNFCAIKVVFAVVFSAELLAVVLSLASVEDPGVFLLELSLVSLMIQWIALTSTALLCLMKNHLQRLPYHIAAMLAWGLLVMIALLVGLMSLWLNEQTPLSLVTDQPVLLLMKTTGIAAIVGLVVLHYLYLLYRWKQQAAAKNAARLQALNSRIRPHFLFNSMNTIASLTRTDPVKAEEVVENLADLFRVSLAAVDRQATLGEELELARQYLSIEKQRLGDRLQVVWDLQAMPESALMPPLVLQPLLENAVYHGVEPAVQGGKIVITGRYRKKRVNISIRNSLPQNSPPAERKGNRLAMENIRLRFSSLYEEEASLVESRIEGEYQVRIVIPHPWSQE
ncbi:MAG: histidine kinase [Gammaproteobacteria bacterium]|nr:histidine kinase [Gammaproteobacteria bacterium]